MVGDWSADVGEVIAVSARLRGLLREGRVSQAREMLSSLCREKQAAVVAVDADPEEILSLTGMDEAGRPGYLAEVVDRLPSSLLTELLVPRDAKWDRFNTGLLASMSEGTFRRTVADTLDPVYFHGRRGAVSWEWLEIVAALQDVDRIASLLQSVDEEVLEDALIPHIDRFAMDEVVFPGGLRFQNRLRIGRGSDAAGDGRPGKGGGDSRSPRRRPGAACPRHPQRLGTGRGDAAVTRLAHPDLNALLRDRSCFAAGAIELGLRFGRLPGGFADTLAAFLRLRSLEFAGRHRTGISIGREGIRGGIEHAFTCFDLGLEQESGADVEHAVELLADPDLPGLCRKGYETACRRLREMRRESEALGRLPRSELLPEFAARLQTWKRITPETFGRTRRGSIRAGTTPSSRKPRPARFVCSLPKTALQSAKVAGIWPGSDSGGWLPLSVRGNPHGPDSVAANSASCTLPGGRCCRVAAPGGGEIGAPATLPGSHRFLLREVEAVIGLGAASGDGFAAAVRGRPDTGVETGSGIGSRTSRAMLLHRTDGPKHEASTCRGPRRVARLDKWTGGERALGIHPRSFARLCRQHGIPSTSAGEGPGPTAAAAETIPAGRMPRSGWRRKSGPTSSATFRASGRPAP